MTKGLEALERMAMPDEVFLKECERLNIDNHSDYEYLKRELQRLEAIDNANPSEALEEIKQIEFYVGTIIGLEFIKGNDVFSEAKKRDYEIFKIKAEKIKQALLKAQQQEKVLGIIKDKQVNVRLLKRCKSVEQYNNNCPFGCELTQEEFDTLKEVLV